MTKNQKIDEKSQSRAAAKSRARARTAGFASDASTTINYDTLAFRSDAPIIEN